jgi:hypothetical protein
VTLYTPEDIHQQFGGKYCLHFRCYGLNQANDKQRELVCSAFSSTLNTEAVLSFEMLVNLHRTIRFCLENKVLFNQRRINRVRQIVNNKMGLFRHLKNIHLSIYLSTDGKRYGRVCASLREPCVYSERPNLTSATNLVYYYGKVVLFT